MPVQAAPRAVEDEVLKLALEISLHLQELEPEHLRVDGDRMVPSTSSLCLVDEIIGFRRLLGDGVDSMLEDLALSACHGGHIRRACRRAGARLLSREVGCVCAG